MKRSLQGKLILSYLVVALLTVLVVSVLTYFTSGQSLMDLVVEQQAASLKEAAIDYYTTNGSMDGFFTVFAQLPTGEPRPPQPADQSGDLNRPPEARDMRGLNGMVDTDYTALIPTLGHNVGEAVPRNLIREKIAVEVDGKTVAWILPDTSNRFKLSPEEELFRQRTTLAIGLAALAGVTAAVGMGVYLSSRLLKPIRQLTTASRALSQGELNQQVPVTSDDELGQLSLTFNQMSADLVRADEQRKRMTADITHDLSTPLQIISGYIEMFEEGVAPLTPQRLEIIKTEIGHLRRLVGDMTTLTQVETGAIDIQLGPVAPADLLRRVHQAFEPIAARQGVELALETAPDLPEIQVDEGRMLQVLKNLVENALRYTAQGGVIHLEAGRGPEGAVRLRVRDSGEGIEPEDLPYVFDRFYRADKARVSSTGKMGLGLSICKALTEAQGGKVWAESAGKGQGATMVLAFLGE